MNAVKFTKPNTCIWFLALMTLLQLQAYCSHVGPVSYVLYLELDEHAPNPER